MVVKGVWGGWGESVKKGKIRDENFFRVVLNGDLKSWLLIVSVDVKADWKQQIKNW